MWNNGRTDIREVASKLVLSFGLERDFSFMQLIRDGINYSLQSGFRNINFLNQAVILYVLRSPLQDVHAA